MRCLVLVSKSAVFPVITTLFSARFQDLQCKKCLGVKELNMPTKCKCAGDFTVTVSVSGDVAHTLRTFRSIAQHFKMPLLAEVVQWSMEMGAIKDD